MFSQIHHCTKCGKRHYNHPAYCKPEKRVIYWWPCGDWCEADELSEYGSMKSDDYSRTEVPIYYTDALVEEVVVNLNKWSPS